MGKARANRQELWLQRLTSSALFQGRRWRTWQRWHCLPHIPTDASCLWRAALVVTSRSDMSPGCLSAPCSVEQSRSCPQAWHPACTLKMSLTGIIANDYTSRLREAEHGATPAGARSWRNGGNWPTGEEASKRHPKATPSGPALHSRGGDFSEVWTPTRPMQPLSAPHLGPACWLRGPREVLFLNPAH